MPDSLRTDTCKAALRQQLRKVRHDQPDKDRLSQAVFQHLAEFLFREDPTTILIYVDVRDELRTQFAIPDLLERATRLAVPYCFGNSLRLVELKSRDDLVPGAYGILEPSEVLKQSASRAIAPTDIDVALIPGLGFDRQGSRIGHGKGYYDRLLPQLRNGCLRIGLGFECQLVENIPTLPHDQQMDFIVTEAGVLDCRRTN